MCHSSSVSPQRSCWHPLLWDMEHVKLFPSNKPWFPKQHCILRVPRICLFTGALAKFWKRLLASSCLSTVCPYVLPHGTTRFPLDEFSRNLIFEYFSKICHENSHWRSIMIFYMKSTVFLIIPRSVLLRMRNVSDKHFREHEDTHFMFSNFFFENRTIFEIREKI